MSEPSAQGKNCNRPVTGNYCSHCGQASISGFSISYLWTLFHQDVLEVDRGLWLTMKSLSIRPGQMMREYLDGKTKPYFSPIKYLLVWIALYYLFGSLSQSLGANLGTGDPDPLWREKYVVNGHEALSFATVQDFMGLIGVLLNRNLSLYFLLLIPFIAFVGRFLFRELNFTEQMIIWTFMWGHVMAGLLILMPIVVVPWALAGTNMNVFMAIMGAMALLMFFFYTWTYKQITKRTWVNSATLLLLTMLCRRCRNR